MKKIFTTSLIVATLICCGCSSAKQSTAPAPQKAPVAVTKNQKQANVYYIKTIDPASLQKVYQAMQWTPTGKLAVKMSTGEPPKSNYLRPELIGKLIKDLNGTIVECNTAYGGGRADTASHLAVAKDHGLTAIAKVDIQDAEGYMTLPVAGGKRLKENYVGSHFKNYDSYLVLSHFKGHAMAGYGGAIKNISIGLGTGKLGKVWIHSGGTSKTNAWGGEQIAFNEAMAEAGKAVSDYLGKGKNIAYINVMNRISVDCDCNGNPAEPDLHDMGILASTDAVALDQACLDLVYAQKSGKGAALVNRIDQHQGLHTVEHAEAIGLGTRNYKLIEIK